MSDWEPGDPLYDQRGVHITHPMVMVINDFPCSPDAAARWTPDAGWE